MSEIEDLQGNIKKLEAQLRKAKKAQYLVCVECGYNSQIGLLDARVVNFYVEPYS